MQFVASHNSPQNYAHLVESNHLWKDDYNHYIHPPGLGNVIQSTDRFSTYHNSKTSHDHFDYQKHLLDNFYDPAHNNELVHHTSFINNRNENPYKNGDARHFFNYNPNLDYTQVKPPYTNNSGYHNPNMYWNPYLNPKKNLENYLTQQVIKNSDQKHLIARQRDNLNSYYPYDINPYSNFVKDFNPSDNYLTGRNNFNMNNANDTPLNHLQSAANVNVPPDAPQEVDTPQPNENIAEHDIMNQTVKELFYNLGRKSMDIINDTVRYTTGNQKNPANLWHIFTRNDRIAYVGILVIIIALLIMILV